ncbi:peptidyl-prolyl cis-trans isomerase D [Geothrix limicola]|uniref:Periplasmic chaperone PpiD n=1 Tax=Geothrix limicola TaxID=2927978 RepID=A0ABQ5QGI9_9BACT|nr:peptidylprolyl isomerase [Geothrix limicola]GLH73551.1 peptidyl-prolyl cis-trans isomerase D [Geothrix limicola]
MLRSFRQVFKSNRTPMAAVMIVVLLGLVAYLAPSGGAVSADTVVARVYGHEILMRELAEHMQELYQRYGKQASPEALKPFVQSQALRDLTNQKLMEELAERHHVVVTDEELAARLRAQLRQYPMLWDANGKLKPTAELKQEYGFNPALMERGLRSELLRTKLIQQAALQVPVDEAWITVENRLRNEKVAFQQATLTVDPNTVADPGDAALEALYKAGGDRFLQPPRRIIQFVAVDRAALSKDLQVDDAALKAAFDARKADNTEFKARHILFKAEGDAQIQEATAKAQLLRERLVKGLDFAKTAEELSEDPSAKGNGGDLGWFNSSKMVKPFSDAAATLKVGEISQPVKTQFGVHLIKLEGRREKKFEDVKADLAREITDSRFNARAQERLEQIRKRANGGDLAAAAKSLGSPAQLSQPFSNEPSAQVEGLPELPQIAGEAFRLKVGEVSKPMAFGDRHLLFRVQEERPEAVPPFKEIRTKVLAAYRLEEARKQAVAKAEQALKSGGLQAVGPVTDQAAAPLSGLRDLVNHPGIRKALLDTPVGQTTPVLWSQDGKLWVARITSREPAPALTFETRRTLIQDVQTAEAQKLLSAEMQSLDQQGRLRPGFSSLWGHFGGIYINASAVQVQVED